MREVALHLPLAERSKGEALRVGDAGFKAEGPAGTGYSLTSLLTATMLRASS